MLFGGDLRKMVYLQKKKNDMKKVLKKYDLVLSMLSK